MARALADIERYLVNPEEPLRNVMARMNEVVPPMLLVAGEDRKLLGAITDGDIRRALLRGAGTDSDAREIMYSKATTGRVGASQDNLRKLDDLVTTVKFLPILDDEGRVVSLLLEDGQGLREVTALVMAGGFGTRLGELTKDVPKPLLPLDGRPMLDHILDSLEEAGIRRIVVSTHYLAEKVERFLAERDSIAFIDTVHESEPLGTGGAIGLLPQQHHGNDLLVLNGDVISDVSFPDLLSYHRSHGNGATICIKERRTKIDFGVIRFTRDGEFESIEEKPELSHFIVAGIYLIDPSIIGLAPPNTRTDMPDLLNHAREVGMKIGVFPVHEHWMDVGRPHDLSHASKRQGAARK